MDKIIEHGKRLRKMNHTKTNIKKMLEQHYGKRALNGVWSTIWEHIKKVPGYIGSALSHPVTKTAMNLLPFLLGGKRKKRRTRK